ncbi:MAG: hypothetical protein ACLQDL_11455 [Spirochaetia bacterium]
MSALGASQRSYSIISAAVARFDVVAADDLGDAGGMEKVLAGMDKGWEASVSRGGFFGFLYNDRVQMVKELGTYPAKAEFSRTPYGAQFRLSGTRFAFNVVVCHVETEKGPRVRAAEVSRLPAVFRYFENLTGNRGITLLLAGGLGDEREDSRSLVARGDVVALKAAPARAKTPGDQGGRMFASASLRPRIEKAGFGAAPPHSAYVILTTGK